MDLLHPELYRVPENPLPIDPADAALLVDEDAAAAGGRGSAKARSVAALPWLMNTQYISNDLYTKSTAPGISEKRMKKIKRDAELAEGGEADVPDLSDKGKAVEAIERGFEAARQPPRHRSKRHLKAVEVLPVLPDFELWGHQWVHAHFDADPLDRLRSRLPQGEQLPSTADAMLKNFSVADDDEEGRTANFLAYMVPVVREGGGVKRARGGEDEAAKEAKAAKAAAKRAKRAELIAAGLLDSDDEEEEEGEGEAEDAGAAMEVGGVGGEASAQQQQAEGGEQQQQQRHEGEEEYRWLAEYDFKILNRDTDVARGEGVKEQYLLRYCDGSLRYSNLNSTLDAKASFKQKAHDLRPSAVYMARQPVGGEALAERAAQRDELLAEIAGAAGGWGVEALREAALSLGVAGA